MCESAHSSLREKKGIFFRHLQFLRNFHSKKNFISVELVFEGKKKSVVLIE